MSTLFKALFVSFFAISLATASTEIETYESRIADMDSAVHAGDRSLFYLEADGRVLRLDATQTSEIEILSQAFQSGDAVRVEVVRMGQGDVVRSIQILPSQAYDVAPQEASGGVERDFRSSLPRLFDELYMPTDVGSYETANALFVRLTTNTRNKSQCYQRAHLWAYSMASESNVKSMKAFLFFTKRYIREYNYEWWFHVAPYVIANGTEYVLDRTFTRQPLEMKAWTDRFISSRVVCPAVERYSDYELNQEAQYCYLRKVPMYYYQPLNVKPMDTGTFITGFRDWDVTHSRRALRGGLF